MMYLAAGRWALTLSDQATSWDQVIFGCLICDEGTHAWLQIVIVACLSGS